MSWRRFTRKPLLILYVLGGLLLVVAVLGWGYKTNIDPERVFWQTLEQSLSTNGVTVQAKQTSNGVTVNQNLQYSLGATNAAHSLTTLSQTGTTVVNEMIGSPKIDYTRYLRIETDQKGADGKSLDFSKLVGLWAKPDNLSSGELLPQAVLGTSLPLGGVAMPIGYLSAEARHELIHSIRDDNVYHINFKETKKTHHDGRLQYTYDIKLNPVAYAAMMKHFAQAVGLHDLDGLDPQTFAQQQDFSVQMTVDVWAHHLVKAASSGEGAAATQTYVGYDLPVTVPLPTKSIPLSELQQRLSKPQN